MPTNRPGDLRRWERQTAAIPVSLVLEPENFRADTSATTIDISLSGVGVRTKLVLVPGEWVGVVPKGEFPHAIPSRVAWVREDASSSGTVAGLSFINTLEV